MIIRPYRPEDREAVHLIWREVRWIQHDKHLEALDFFLDASRIRVAEIEGEAECLATSAPATLRYLDEDLDLSAITAVTTSHTARKLGLARRVTANLIAADAREGALVSALGMFEQGFYDQLGYGTGSYEHTIRFDPAALTVSKKPRSPRRLTHEDWALMHHAMVNRRRGHGACTILPTGNVRGELGWTEEGFGLGYCDDTDTTLTHFFWGSLKGEHGPLTLIFLAFQNGEQFLELMALLKALADQIRLVQMNEPHGIQVQDLIRNPFRLQEMTANSDFANACTARAYWQIRICDLAGCLAQTHLPHDPVRFNLTLHDPIATHLDAETSWRGLSGHYVVTLGPISSARPGEDANLLTLTASVGAFTRLWLGIRPASGLAITDALSGPDTLLRTLDNILCLPPPITGWDF